MKQILCSLAVLLTTAAAATAQQTDERPEYSRMYNLTVVYGSPMTKLDTMLHAFMREDAIMKQLVAQTVYNEYTNDRKLIANTAWKDYLGGARPAILLQGPALPNGKADVIFFAMGDQVECSSEFTNKLHTALMAYIQLRKLPAAERDQWTPRCPDGGCPLPRQPRNPPPPPATPPPIVPPAVIPPSIDIDVNQPDEPDEEEEEEEEGTPLILFVLTGLAAAAAGMYASQKKQDS
jgi:hypothetical protein